MPLYTRPDYAQETTPNWKQWLQQYNQQAQQRQHAAGHTGQAMTGGVGGVAPALIPGLGAHPAETYKDTTATLGPEGLANTAMGRQYQSNPDNTYTEQIGQDLKTNMSNPASWAATALMPGNHYKEAYQSYKSFGRAQGARDKYARQVEAENKRQHMVALQNWAVGLDPRIGAEADRRRTTGSEMTEDEIRQMYGQLMQQDTAKKLSGDVEGYFSDPQRLARQESDIQANRTAQLGNVADQYNTLNTKQAQNSASRGMLGSSVDAQQSGQVAAGRDQAAMGVENNAANARYGNQMNDQDQRRALLNMINSRDPSQSQQASDLLSGISQGTADWNSIFGGQRQQRQIGDYANQIQSEAYGSAFNNGATAVNAYGPYLQAYAKNGGAGG